MNITSNEIRKKYLEFFKSKNHAIIPSAPVVPDNDPTVLFTTAGMHPLVPYLLWERHPLWNRLANYQKCVRTGDIDDVWDNTHLTFFEMLWNWSLWDYFKKESIAWSYEFLISKDWLWIDVRKIAVTVFEWDENASRDDESASIWKSHWITNISYLGKDDNWWWPAWITWPCGPDTEIFYRVWKQELPPAWSTVWNDSKNWMEIWNNVFMEFVKDENGNYNKAAMQNVDTGMWLERITRTLTGAPSVYESDIFMDIIEEISKTLWKEYSEETRKSIRIIADHTRTSVMMISDWVAPANVDQWYVLRRLLRRAIREWYKLWNKWQFLTPIANKIIWKFEDIYETVKKNKQKIITEIEKEEKQFLATLENGLKEFEKLVKWLEIAFEKTGKKIDTISWDKAFKLYDTYWFPIEMTKELAEEKWLNIDENWFKEAFKKHKDLSRAWAEQKFKWWLADSAEETTALHTAAHLMLAWIRKVLWADIHQKWSNITAERLRFDFNYPEKVSPEKLKEIEDFVNNVIEKNCAMILDEIKKSEAESDKTIEWSFWEKYPEIVKVYTVKDSEGNIYSRELCWWPHITNTSTMGKFRITKEESSSAGVRRIKAVLEK